MELMGKMAIVTGATGKVGGRVAEYLAERGCRCVCHYFSNSEKAERLVERIRSNGGQGWAVQWDLGKLGSIADFFGKCAEFGRAEILVNSASVFERIAVEDITAEKAVETVNLNLCGPLLLCGQFSKALGANEAGRDGIKGKIINLSDVAGERGWGEYSLYCACKAGLNNITKSLAKELAPGICVNAVALGVIEGGFSEGEMERQIQMVPVGRAGKAEEVCHAIGALLENDYITGEILRVDGGRGI